MKTLRLHVMVVLILTLFTAALTHQVARAYVICCTWPIHDGYYKLHSSLPSRFTGPTDRGANAWTAVLESAWVWHRDTYTDNYVKYGAIDGKYGTSSADTLTVLNLRAIVVHLVVIWVKICTVYHCLSA